MEEESLTVEFPGWDDVLFHHLMRYDPELAERFHDYVVNHFPYVFGEEVPAKEMQRLVKEFEALMAEYRVKAWSSTRRKSDERDYLVQRKVTKSGN